MAYTITLTVLETTEGILINPTDDYDTRITELTAAGKLKKTTRTFNVATLPSQLTPDLFNRAKTAYNTFRDKTTYPHLYVTFNITEG